MSTSLVAMGAMLATRLMLLLTCVEREPVTSQLALGIAFANGQLSGLPGAKLAVLRDSSRRLIVEYHRATGPEASKLINPGLWLASSQPIRERLVRLEAITELYDSGRPNETESDECLADAISCQATTPTCLAAQTSGVATGYPLTHRLLYAIVTDKMECPTTKAFQTRQLCSLVLREATAIAEWGFPVEFQDLFSEQVALCGSLGYNEFLRPDWLLQIAAWQLPTGCYAEKPGYSGHRTAVSAAALAVGIRAAALAATSLPN